MHVADGNFYPAAFLSMKVTSVDSNGNPTITKFYKDYNFSILVFTWIQTFDGNDKVDSWKVIFPA